MTNLMKMKWLFVACTLVSTVFVACNSSSNNLMSKYKIEAPIPELAKAYTEFEIDPTKENKLELPSGTKITIAANSLVNANGDLLSGNAIIQYREYHDAVDVMLSGIPMDYEAQGRKRTMQTAGMFDINAQQNGAPVFVKEGAGVQVDFASFEEGIDYNFFALSEERGWEFIDYVAPKPNEARLALDQEISKLSKKLKTKKKHLFVFNYRAVLDVEYKDDWNKINENRKNPKLVSKVKRYGLDYYKSSVFSIVKYKGNSYPADMMVWKNKSNRKWPSWTKSQRCQMTLKSKGGNYYTLEATEPKEGGKSFTTTIELVVPLKYLFKYSPKEWEKNPKNIMNEVSKQEEKYRLEMEALKLRQEQQAATIRSFQIAGFGVYNYDKLMKEDDRIDIIANFKMEGVDDLDLVICLPEDNKTVIKYPKRDWDKVALLPSNKARFISIMPNKKIGIYSIGKYQALEFDDFSRVQKSTVNFELVKVIDELDSEEQLRTLLNG